MNTAPRWSITTLLLCLLVLFAPACSLLTPQQRLAMREQVQAEYEAGNLTVAQRDAAIEALDGDEPVDWESLGIAGFNLVMALLGAPLVVRAMRGPPTQRVGLPADKVKTA